MAFAVGEFNPSPDLHAICVTSVQSDSKTSGYMPGYHILSQFSDPPFVVLSDDDSVFQEGTGSLKIEVKTLDTQWIRRGIQQDWSNYDFLKFWWYSDQIFSISVIIYDTSDNWVRFYFQTSQGWTHIELDLSNPSSSYGTMDWENVKEIFFQFIPQGTHRLDDLRGDDTQILNLDADSQNWQHEIPEYGQYCHPSIAGTDTGYLVAAWIKKIEGGMVIQIATQPQAETWDTEWSSPIDVHTALDIDPVCCVPIHGENGGVDIYFRAKSIIDQEWYLYRVEHNETGTTTEKISVEGIDVGDWYEDNWTATVLPDNSKIIVFKASTVTASKAVGIIRKTTAWEKQYITTYIKQGENYVLFDEYLFEDGFHFQKLIYPWCGGGVDKDGIIHATCMALKYVSGGGTDRTENLYFRIDLETLEAYGEFLFQEMGFEFSHDRVYLGVAVEFNTRIPHVFFKEEGPSYDIVYHASYQDGWMYQAYYGGTRNELGAARDDFSGCVYMTGSHWENRDDYLLRGSFKTINASMAPHHNPFRQSHSDTAATF
ncbi:MAG: hypothetical protein HXS43_11940, partial [Theionarchaea archaeon]|nr:hypothetical protein [Theionarchaea archaeon]